MFKHTLWPVSYLILIASLIGFSIWYIGSIKKADDSALTEEVHESSVTASSSVADNLIEREPSVSDRLVYINQLWRFSFEYPKGWEIREPAFGSGSSLFNLAVWPETRDAFDPVTINITPKWWIEKVLNTSAKDKKVSTTLFGRPGWTYPSVTMSVLETQEYLVLIHDEYWVNISIQDKFASELQMVLDTFEFHNPPTLAEIGIDKTSP